MSSVLKKADKLNLSLSLSSHEVKGQGYRFIERSTDGLCVLTDLGKSGIMIDIYSRKKPIVLWGLIGQISTS